MKLIVPLVYINKYFISIDYLIGVKTDPNKSSKYAIFLPS